MAGHSKWANIKRRKEAQDNKKGKIFTRLIREVTVAARGGADPESNAQLRLALSRAYQANMSKDTIERAVARGSGQQGADDLERIFYEGYGPGGVAYYVETLTDNRNRTVAEVRHAFSKCGGSLSAAGSVAYLFTQMGVCEAKAPDEDSLLELLIDFDIDRIEVQGEGVFVVVCSSEALSEVVQALSSCDNTSLLSHSTPWLCDPAEISLTEAQSQANDKLVDMLENLDDVQEVTHNLSEDV